MLDALFDLYPQYELYVTSFQLIASMLGMGATLHVAEFRDVWRQPRTMLLVLVLQFLVMPSLAVGLAWACGVPAAIAMGWVLLTALPSGSLSNVFTYLGGGNTPLSITATCASTAACLVVTPGVLAGFGGIETGGTRLMPVGSIMLQISLLLLAPLALGMGIGYWQHAYRHAIARWMIRASIAALVLIVTGALGSGQVDAWQYGILVPAATVGFVVLTLLLTDSIVERIGYSDDDAYTLAIEVAMRNGNLGLSLCATLFSAGDDPQRLGSGCRYVCLLASGAMIVAAGLAVLRRRFRGHRSAVV